MNKELRILLTQIKYSAETGIKYFKTVISDVDYIIEREKDRKKKLLRKYMPK